MRRAAAAVVVALLAYAGCFSQPDYQGGGRLDSLPGVGDDGGDDQGPDDTGEDSAAPPVDAFVAPQDGFVAPPNDAGGGG